MGQFFLCLGALFLIRKNRWRSLFRNIRKNPLLKFFRWGKFNIFPMYFLGVAGMPRRIPDYPDAYFIFNKIAS
jgi:cytochrome c oxidase subunit 1